MPAARFILECPLLRGKDFAAWPDGLDRVYVFDDAAKSAAERAASFAGWTMEILRRDDRSVFTHPLECWASPSRMEHLLAREEFRDGPVCLQESYWLIPCRDQQSLRLLMEKDWFNQLVFFAAPTSEEAVETVQRAALEDDPTDGRLDTPFLKFCDRLGGFVFYSFTHDNLEIVGRRRFIVGQCLPYLLAVQETAARGEAADA